VFSDDANGGARSARCSDHARDARIARTASKSSTVAIRRRRPPQRGQASTSIVEGATSSDRPTPNGERLAPPSARPSHGRMRSRSVDSSFVGSPMFSKKSVGVHAARAYSSGNCHCLSLTEVLMIRCPNAVTRQRRDRGIFATKP
jgi:hypothetical protein